MEGENAADLVEPVGDRRRGVMLTWAHTFIGNEVHTQNTVLAAQVATVFKDGIGS
jgi:hypothetical protein